MTKKIAILTFVLATVLGLEAFAASDVKPNLVARPAHDIRLTTPGETKLLRFSTTSWNSGQGALELRAGEIDTTGRQNVYQRIYNDAGGFHDELAGTFVWHPTHSHFHFDDYATYTLQPIDAPGGSERTGAKTTFCVMDTTRVNTKLPGAPRKAVYATCGSLVQGMSVGWGDTYGYQLAGQELDITGLPDGVYRLTIAIDPKNKIVETEDSADNTSTVDIVISGNSVSVVGAGGPGRGNH